MRSLALRIVVVLVVAAVVAMPAHAQRRGARRGRGAPSAGRPEFGAHVGYNFDFDHVLFGAQASFPITPQLAFYPSFDYYTGGGGTVWALNFDLKVRPRRYRFWYGGAGLNLLHAVNTNSHLNLFSGLEGRPGPMRPYAEVRLTVGDGSSFQIVGGLSFPLR